MINKYNIKVCQMNNCLPVTRYHRDIRTNIINSNECDNEFIFYLNVFDSIHCYLNHMYDIGMRIKIMNKNIIITLMIAMNILKILNKL